ncbi:unnamed protein product [Caenorhabditis angaria]|uniref:Uncharacterized protein n=1 Tax=Caenorhabditis angaria TaxID=860376 RepID=A0A9P1MWK7_9PELO|nr:unnamed protein product [Caenorhabditis angaria]
MLKKGTFLYFYEDLDENSQIPRHIWAIENHVMLCKWVKSGNLENQYQITNRYTIWKSSDLERYRILDISPESYEQAGLTGLVTIGNVR